MFGSKRSSMRLNTPPSEILCQTLFISYAQRLAHARSKRLILFAPTQPEEELTGYDASLIGNGCRELYLQFKRGNQNSIANTIRFKIDNTPSRNFGAKQLDALKTQYPPLSSYYVVSSFWNVQSAMQAQRLITNIEDFLDLYIAVSAHAIELPLGKKSSQVCLGNRYIADNTFKKDFAPHMVQAPAKMAHGNAWLYGSELFNEFFKGSLAGVGCSIRIQNKQVVRISNPIADQITKSPIAIPITPAMDAIFSERQRIPNYRNKNTTVLLTMRVFDD